MSTTPRKQGFAAMDPERLRQIAAAGGRAKRKYPLPNPGTGSQPANTPSPQERPGAAAQGR